MAHWIGNKSKPATPTGEQKTNSGTSLAVLQFLEIARGVRAVQVPGNGFRVASVTAEERYCLGCCGVRWFDVISAVPQGDAIRYQVAICRCCGRKS